MEPLKILQAKTQENQSLRTEPQTGQSKFCEKHGEYPRYHVTRFGKKIEQICPLCRDEAVAAREAEEKKDRAEKELKLRLHKSNIPKRYLDMSFKDLDLRFQENDADNQQFISAVNSIKKFLATIPERLEQGSSGYFCGECGTGKTLLACLLVKGMILQGYQAHYTTAWQVIQQIRQGYGQKSEVSTQGYIREYINKPLLAIDEVGVQNGTNDERVLLYQVIDGRYNEVKPTILISNSKSPVDDGYLDLRTIDRLKEGNGFSYTFNGESYRK